MSAVGYRVQDRTVSVYICPFTVPRRERSRHTPPVETLTVIMHPYETLVNRPEFSTFTPREIVHEILLLEAELVDLHAQITPDPRRYEERSMLLCDLRCELLLGEDDLVAGVAR
jgi:hypothetical protein